MTTRINGKEVISFKTDDVLTIATIFEHKQIYDNNLLYWDNQELSGSGTNSVYNQNESSTILSVSGSVAGTRVRQTFRRMNYQSGSRKLSSQISAVLGNGQAGITRSLGLFEDNDGLFFSQQDLNISVVIRSSVTGTPVDTIINQIDWNIDTFDGNGPSGLNLDFSKIQDFFIEFRWLGAGIARFGFIIDGQKFLCHEEQFANLDNRVFIRTPNLPIRFEIENDGTGVASEIECGAVSVSNEGVPLSFGIQRTISTEGVHLNANSANTIYTLFVIRTQLAAPLAEILVSGGSFIAETNDNFEVMLILNPTINGILTYNPIPGSGFEFALGDTTNTIVPSTGIVEARGFFQSAGSGQINLTTQINPGIALDGTRDILGLAIRPLSSNADFQGTLTFKELL